MIMESKKKIVITEDLKNILIKVNSDISKVLLQDDMPENIIRPEKGVNYLDLSRTQKGHISYLTKERIYRIEENRGDFWELKTRYHGRPGSVMKKMFSGFGDWEIENFATQFLSIVDPPVYEMKVVKGEDVSKYYHYKTYYNGSGALGMSCMKSSPSEFFEIYVKNPDQIQMLIMFDQHNKVMGRAIIWPTIKLMDRIYTNLDSHVNYFYDWARENDYYYKQHNNWFTPKHIMCNGIPEIKEFEVSLKNTKFDKYPYLDTFKWLDVENKKVYNYIPKNKELITISDHMGGYLKSNHFGFCDITNNLRGGSEISYLDYIEKNVGYDLLNKSKSLQRDILVEDSKMIDLFKDEKHRITDFIFNEKYDHLNDYELIEKKKKETENDVKNGKYDDKKISYYWESLLNAPDFPTQEEIQEYDRWVESGRSNDRVSTEDSDELNWA